MNKEDKKTMENSLAIGGSAVGAAGLKSVHDKGLLTGRETLWHNTNKENVDGIMKGGIKASKTLDPETIVSQNLTHIPKEKLQNKTYMARNKNIANSVGGAYIKNQKLREGNFLGAMNDVDNIRKAMDKNGPRRNIKGRVPTWKMNEVENPELLGAKNWRQYKENLTKARGKDIVDRIMPNDMSAKASYNLLSRKGTATFEGDVPSKYLKGSKNYEKLTAKEIGQYIKSKPGRFAKGVGATTLAAGGIGYGLNVAKKRLAEAKKDKHKKDILNKAASYNYF